MDLFRYAMIVLMQLSLSVNMCTESVIGIDRSARSMAASSAR
jgi:hypothetical protein